MKSFFPVIIICILLLTLISCSSDSSVIGCTDRLATNFDINAEENCSSCCTYPPKQGGVLFYIDDEQAIPRCGNFVVTISNGKQTTITGYYPFSPPANCVNQVGGYVLLDVGTYQYTVTSQNCATGTLSLTVNEGCNKVKI